MTDFTDLPEFKALNKAVSGLYTQVPESVAYAINDKATAFFKALHAALTTPATGGAGGAKELLAKAHWHGWFCRERLYSPDLGPFDYPAGLDYEGQEEYAFNKFFNSFSTQSALAAPAPQQLAGGGAGEWVAVGERLPEQDKEIMLVHTCSNLVVPAIFYKGVDEPYWGWLGENALINLDEATHWQPLPAAPSQGKEAASA